MRFSFRSRCSDSAGPPLTSLLPREQFSYDFHIVEFPKSGITWLTLLLANMCLRNSGSPHTATFSSVRSYIPDLNSSPRALAHTFDSPKARFYKSHSRFEPEMIHVIYITRHPRDVMRSYHRYRSGLGHYSNGLEAFCAHPEYGINAWKEHVNSWLTDRVNGGNRFLHLVRYEDLLKNAAQELRELSRNFGWTIADGTIAQAVDASSRDVMRDQEALARYRNPGYSFEFVSEQGYEEIPKTLARRIGEMCQKECALLGYEI